MTQILEHQERRAEAQTQSGIYTPGIVRVERQAVEAIGIHDAELDRIKLEEWQRVYSLLDHSVKVSRVVREIGEVRKEDDEPIHLGTVAGLLHDTGKMDINCHIYRLNRVLTPAEKEIMNRHAIYSHLFVLDKMSKVRVEDRSFLGDVARVVRHHHTPWYLRDPLLRIKGYDLKLADIFVSLQETRHRPGLSQFQAITALEEIVLRELRDPQKALFASEMQSSLQTIARIYGPPVGVSVPEALERG